MPPNPGHLDRYKLRSEFGEGSVTHRTIQSDLITRRRRIEIVSTWIHDRKLGAGAFGEVSLQREKESGQLRAVKVIAKTQLQTNEMQTLIDLQDHRDLFVAFLGWYEDPHAVHIAMEYIEHGDLGKYIADYPVKARSETKEIASQILEGLVVLHEREICHRDLKPQNVLMASLSPLWLKITDFGIAKHWGGTELRTQCGTVIYQAPELLGLLPRHMRHTGQSYTPSIDIWALGAVLHQVLTSEVPFTETSSTMTGMTGMTTLGWSSIDAELLLNYCAGREPFPDASLSKHGAIPDTISFVKSLMVPDPKDRVSAADALKSAWVASIAMSPIIEVPPPDAIVNLILLMGDIDSHKLLFATIFCNKAIDGDGCFGPDKCTFRGTPITDVGNERVQLIIGSKSPKSPIDYADGLQSWIADSGAPGRKVSGIVRLGTPTLYTNINNRAKISAQLRRISVLCAPYFISGMMVGIGIRKEQTIHGIFTNQLIGVTEATSPRSAIKIQCIAVVRHILRQQWTAVALNFPSKYTGYLSDLSGSDLRNELFMNLESLPEPLTSNREA